MNLTAIKTYRCLLRLDFPVLEEKGAVEPEERFIQRVIDPYVLPGESRLHLQEWLLESFEPGILSDPDISLPGITPAQKLAVAYDQLGIRYESLAVIEGNAGSEPCQRLLHQLAEFVAAAKSAENPAEPLSTAEANTILENSTALLGYISDNRERVFFTEPKLFPPTFPPRNLQAAKCDKVGELQRAIEKWQNEIEGVKSQVALISKEFIESEQFPPSQEQLVTLKQSLTQFVQTLRLFKTIYEEKMQPELQSRYFGTALAPHESEILGLGKEAAACLTTHCKIMDLMKALEDVWSYVQVCMDNGDVSHVRSQELFGDNTIAELSFQVKALKELMESQ